MEDLKNSYLDFIESKRYNIKSKLQNDIRIATFNVHYWTDVWENNKYKKLLEDIKYINADFIILQEVILGSNYKVNNGRVNTEKLVATLDKMGYYVYFCNTLPNWNTGIYGNMFCVKHEYVEKINITSHTFKKPGKTYKVRDNMMGGNETRCFLQIEIGNLVIIGTHLDVGSESVRKSQINTILSRLNSPELKNKKSIIMGDFNTTILENYKEKQKRKNIMEYVFRNSNYLAKNNVISLIKKHKFKSATKLLNIDLTVWSNIQCDYIFTRKINNIKPQILYTSNSDHLPLIIDIKSNNI